MRKTETVRNFNGKILAKIETDSQGNKIVKDLYGRILGRYNKKANVTKDTYGRIIARGDQSSMLICK